MIVMTLFYLLLIAHIVVGLFCAHLVRGVGLKAKSWFVAGTVLGGLGLLLCCLRLADWKPSFKRTRIARPV